MIFKLLKKKDFSLLIFAELVSFLGTQFQDFALSLYVLKITGSAAKFASVLAIALIPQLILGPFAGVFVDWFDRKKIIILLNSLNGFIIILLSIICFNTNGLKLSYIYAAVILLSINSTLFNPAVRTIIPSIMKKEELLEANSIDSFIKAIGTIAAPILAGIIYGFYGLLPILIFNSISFLFASFSEIFINVPKTEKTVVQFSLKQFHYDFKAGLQFIKQEKFILSICICAFAINFALNPIVSIGFTFISKNMLKVTDSAYGIMSGICGIGLILGPVAAGIIGKKISIIKIFTNGVLSVTLLLGIIAFSISHLYLNLFKTSLLPAITFTILLLIVVAICVMINITLNTMFQRKVPNEMLGRVNSILMVVATAACPLGQIFFGVLFDKLSVCIVPLIGAAIMLLAIFCFKAFNRTSTLTASSKSV